MAKFRWTKDAGANWTVVEASLPYNISGVTDSDTVTVEPIGDAVTAEANVYAPIFVAVSESGTGNRIMTSPDGMTWTTRTSVADTGWWTCIYAPSLKLFVAIAAYGTGYRIQTSPDGVTWTARAYPEGKQWTSVCWSPELELFVAVANSGTGNRVMTSPDGINWQTRVSAADNNWTSVCWSPELELFVAVANSGTGNRIMTSPDGMTWTTRTSVADNNWLSVCWSPEQNLFVAVAGTGTNRIMTSPDGVTWTARTSPLPILWTSVCWSPEIGRFVAVGSGSVAGGMGTGNYAMTSPDGVTWTAYITPVANTWSSITWSPELELFCVVANSGTGNRVMTSPDGMTWTARSSAADNNWKACTYGNVLATPLRVSEFTVAPTSTHTTVPITAFVAYGVATGYAVTETATPPAIDDGVWTTDPWREFTFSGTGNRTAYAWVKNLSGVSAARTSSTLINNVSPVITTFSMPATADNVVVPVTAFEATGAVAYMITEGREQPDIDDERWSATAPTTFTFSGSGDRIAYPWVKNSVGTISDLSNTEIRDELFLDSVNISSTDLTYVVNRPVKYASNPTFISNNLNSADYSASWPVVHRLRNNDYRMWYSATTYGSSPVMRWCYAVSDDGINFVRPKLGLYSYGGNTDNNIIFPEGYYGDDVQIYDGAFYACVDHTPTDPTTVTLMQSDDGVNWSIVKLVSSATHEAYSIVRRDDGRWLVYYHELVTTGYRSIAAFLSDTTNFAGTYTNLGVLIPGSEHDEKYSIGVRKHGELYFGILDTYNATISRMDRTELYVSRDGVTWTLLDASWALAGSSIANWDYGNRLVGPTLLQFGNDWRHYYGAWQQVHSASSFHSAVGFETVGYRRIGGLTGTGTCVTDALGGTGELYINADASGGSIAVECLDISGNVISGFAYTDCVAISTDTISQRITWDNQPMPSNTNSLKFYVTSATLHAFSVGSTANATHTEVTV